MYKDIAILHIKKKKENKEKKNHRTFDGVLGRELRMFSLFLFLVLFLDEKMPYVFLPSVSLNNFAMCWLISNIFKVKIKFSDTWSLCKFCENWIDTALEGHLV